MLAKTKTDAGCLIRMEKRDDGRRGKNRGRVSSQRTESSRRSCETARVAHQCGEVFSINASIPSEDGIAICQGKSSNVEIRQEVHSRQEGLTAIGADHFLLPLQIFQPASACGANAVNIQGLDRNLVI